jgi:hypothetical protein
MGDPYPTPASGGCAQSCHAARRPPGVRAAGYVFGHGSEATARHTRKAFRCRVAWFVPMRQSAFLYPWPKARITKNPNEATFVRLPTC